MAAAEAVPGVLDILTHWNVGDQAKKPALASGGETTTTMESDQVWHDGQIIAVVVADTYEAAREAAHRVGVTYTEEQPAATFGSPGAEEEQRDDGEHEDYSVGDADAAFAAAPVRVDARYSTPTQHHNPIELYTTTCAWNGNQLTIWEPSQFVYGLRGSVAKQIGIEPEKIRVVSKFVGGAFGSKGGATARTAWVAIAARRLGRPVKLVATRSQGYTIVTYRAETRHHIQLGADTDGKLLALRHEGWEVTSRPSTYNVSGTESTARAYACPNILTRVNIVHADRNTPGFMRAPPDLPYMFALESAIDELACELGMDPIELRRRNEPERDPVTGLPFSSWNAGARAIMGYTEAEIVGRSGEAVFTSEDRASGRFATELRRALETGRASNERWHLRRDGTRFWASGLMMPLLDGDGHPCGFLNILRDRTEVQAAAERRELLMAEMNHRIKNTFAMVQGVATQTRRHTETVGEFQAAFAARLTVLARSNDILTRGEWHDAPLREVIGSALDAYGGERARRRAGGSDEQAVQWPIADRARAEAQGRDRVRLWCAVRGGARPSPDLRGSRASDGGGIRRRHHRQPDRRAQPIHGRHDLGHVLRTAREDGDRFAGCALRER